MSDVSFGPIVVVVAHPNLFVPIKRRCSPIHNRNNWLVCKKHEKKGYYLQKKNPPNPSLSLSLSLSLFAKLLLLSLLLSFMVAVVVHSGCCGHCVCCGCSDWAMLWLILMELSLKYFEILVTNLERLKKKKVIIIINIAFLRILFQFILGNIPVSILEWLNSSKIDYPQNGKFGRALCQISFLQNLPESTGMTGFWKESVGQGKDLRLSQCTERWSSTLRSLLPCHPEPMDTSPLKVD